MDMLILFLLCCAAAGYAIWKYDSAERNDYKKATQAFAELKAEVDKYKKDADSWKAAADTAVKEAAQLRQAVDGYRSDVDKVQEHCANLREGQIELRDRSFPRKIQVSWKPQGAIPIEIMGPSKAAPRIPAGPPPVPGTPKTTPTNTQEETKPKRPVPPKKQPLGRGVKSVLGGSQ